MSKALIKETQEIFDVENEYSIFYRKYSFEFKFYEEVIPQDTSQTFVNGNKSTQKEGTWFLLSNGKEYHQDDIIIGIDRIREHQLNKIV